MALLRNLLATLLGPVVLTAGIPYALLRAGLAPLPETVGLAQAAGVIVMAGGLAIACWCMAAFIFVGRGMPTSLDPPRQLVTHGLYRLTRNPMYGGVLLIVAGEALALESMPMALYTILAWLTLHLFVIHYEEPAMRRRFGDDYARYCRSTPRWLPCPIDQTPHMR